MLPAGTGSEIRLSRGIVRDYAVFTINPDGCVSSWEAGAESIYGYTDEEIN